MATTRRKMQVFPDRAAWRLMPVQRRKIFAGLAATLLLIVLVLPAMCPPPSSPQSRRASPRCGAAGIGELGDKMVSMLPKDLAFTVFVPSPESFLRVLKLRPNDSDDDAYAVVSRVLGFSAVPRRLRSVDVPVAPGILESVSGLKISAWRDMDGVLIVNGVRSECVDMVRDETVVHVMAGVLMDAEFQRHFCSELEDDLQQVIT